MMNQFGSLFLVVALVWVLQLVFSLFQTRRFHGRVAVLRKGSYATGIGYSGSTWKTKVYGVLVVNDELSIIAAEKLSGFTVFAALKPVPALVGLQLDRLSSDQPVTGVSKKAWNAFQNAAGYIMAHHEADADDDAAEEHPVDGKEGAFRSIEAPAH
jgi:glucitol operon activator protein